MGTRRDTPLVARMNQIRARLGIGWNEFRSRFFHCPWCTSLLWKFIKTGPGSMVLCMNCKMPYLSQQVINFWEEREAILETKKMKRIDKDESSGKRYFGDSNLPIFRFDRDEPDD